MAIDPNTLRIDLEEQEAWRRRLTVTVPAGTVQTERNKIIQKLGGRLKLPGFRKGKVPTNVVEQRFGTAVDQEMLDKVIGDAYKIALQSQELQPISEGQVEDVKYEPREDLTFAQVEAPLEPLPGGFRGLRSVLGHLHPDATTHLGILARVAGRD